VLFTPIYFKSGSNGLCCIIKQHKTILLSALAICLSTEHTGQKKFLAKGKADHTELLPILATLV